MRLVFLVLMTSLGVPAVAEPEPVLIEKPVAELVPRELLVPLAWTVAIAGTGTAVALSVWAWDQIPAPASFVAFCWATLAAALTAVALEVVTEAPASAPN